MPRRKKNDQSPARLPGGPPEGGSLGHNSGYQLPQLYEGAMASDFPGGASVSSADKEKMVRSMQEMFSHLDPEVIYIVLSECDFKVENAMDSLLELSVAAEDAVPIPPPVSGFEHTAAALLSPRHFSKPTPDPDFSKPSQQPSSPPSTNLLTEELDLLVDQELQTLTGLQDQKEEHHNSKYLPAGTSLSSFPPPPVPQQALPELLQSSLEPGFRGPSAEQPGPVGALSGASSPPNQLSTWQDDIAEGQQSVLDFTHLTTETSADKPKPPLHLAASGRPSAFQVYKKQDPPHTLSDRTGLMQPDAVAGGARSKVDMLNSPWNPDAPVFLPRIHGNQGPAFITPVAQSPSNWPSQPRHASYWLSQGPVIQAPLKPSATIPKSWAVPAAPQVSAKSSRLCLDGKLLVLLRGAPGSGKSTMARALLEHNPGGVILSTDDYYYRNGTYQFDPTTLGEAHEWNHKRAKEAFMRGTKPIIIDNTNMQGWEMRPYVAQALKHGYKVLFREPDTWWKNKPKELERRTTHNIPVEKIRRMLNGYERFVTIQAIMGSKMPERKQQLLLENRDSQPLSPETPCPDLVDQPGLTEKCKKSRPQLFSSLPDVSSVGRSGEVGMLEDGTHKSTESLNVQLSERSTENHEISIGDDFDLGDLDSELDDQVNQLNPPNGDQRIPDCIVESVMNEDSCGTEKPVAFSESIGQRVRRERPSRRSGFDNMEPADLVKDTNQEKTNEEESEGAELAAHMGEKEMHKMLNFVGDWPSEGPLEQRQVRKRDTHEEVHGSEDEDASQECNDHEKTASTHSGPDLTELQKLFDLIQTGVVVAETSSSRSCSISLSSGEELEREDEAGGLFEESHGSRSNSEERNLNIGRVNISRELPDCVLDWNAADSCVIREIKNDNIGTTITERTDREALSMGLKAPDAENPFPTFIEKTKEENVAHSIEGETGIDVDSCTENSRETRIEADGSHISDTCQSIVSEGSVETESSPFSQEKKQRQGRRSGKQCKLALTFTQNCPDSLLNTLDSPNTTAQDLGNSQNSINCDVKPNFNPNTSLILETNVGAESETDQQQASPLPLVDTGRFTQTEPQDFALLWRLNQAGSPDDAVFTVGSHGSDVRVVSGDSSRFVPELSSAVSAAVAVHPSGHREVPYHVVHEKGTQVEEREFGVTQDRLENLRILSRHFKLVSFDTLEDLYDKCHQDLEWTTNLLLDSGERFFRDEDCEGEEVGAADEDDYHASTLHAASSEAVETSSCPIVFDQHQPEDRPERETNVIEDGSQQSNCETATESDDSANNTEVSSFGGAAIPATNNNHPHPDTTLDLETSPQAEPNLPEAVKEGERCDDADHKVISESDLEGGAWGGSFDNGVTIEDSRIETEDDIASLEEITRLLLDNLEEMERQKKSRNEERRSQHLSIQCVELKLPTELALQLTELFGPVGIDPDTCPADDYTVQMDLSLAKLLHQKWKETIQERQRQATLSFHLLQESSTHWGDSQVTKPGIRERTPAANFLINTDSHMSLDNQPDAFSRMPFMDHWNAPRPHVSLRDIIKEEQALQENIKKTRQNRVEVDRRDGATLLKENQLYSLFPSIDRHFLQDIFRDHNYSLTQTELFLRSLLDEEPVKTVVAPEAPRSDYHRAASKEREKRQKPLESIVPSYQDTEDPEYTDFRAEAKLQRSRQLESFAKAAEAYKQGRKEVASFYAQQGHLHGHRMREANHRAAVQIFERVNSSLLPKNILDLHGLHVDEAREHLARVLEDKTADFEQGLCRPQLSVITGRGNHSQGGVARIRPAVIDYLTSKQYRFTEPKPGLVLVSLK
uniref:NEDD4 binding protein 2 n=1 Tax=Amphiprion percula TaxID=161767 RepID=A0A3P8TUS1_AMPPE